jgi:hypothetical protein
VLSGLKSLLRTVWLVLPLLPATSVFVEPMWDERMLLWA